MMRVILSAALALCLGMPVGAATPYTTILSAGMWLMKDQRRVYQIDVESVGDTYETAKAEAFRTAVEQAVGSVVLAESEVVNSDLKRREIVSYASGYVQQHEVISRENTDRGVRLQMRVWVSHSQIADRLLAKSQTAGAVAGSTASVALSTVNAERVTGDRMLSMVLRDYPTRAFQIEMGQTNFAYNSRRVSSLEIPVTVSWDSRFVTALNEALTRTAQDPDATPCRYGRPCANQAFIKVSSAPGGSRFTSLLGYTDTPRFDLVRQELVGSAPMLLLKVRTGGGAVVAQRCYNLPEISHVVESWVPTSYMVDDRQNRLDINGQKTVRTKLTLNLVQNYVDIEQLEQAQIEVVRYNQCPA